MPGLSEYASSYAGLGLEIFPVNPDSKRPLVSQYRASVDPGQVEAWWERWPKALIGHLISERHLLWDIDPRHGGKETWKALRAEVEPFTTRTHLTGRGDGGGHIWFLRPDGRIAVHKLDAWAEARGLGHQLDGGRWRSGIDLLHAGHRYTILPPSPHPDTGKPYRWAPGKGLALEPIAMPALFAELVVADEREVEPADAGPHFREVDSPADWYSATARWADLLPRHGWTLVRGDGDSNGCEWRHPAATNEISATTRHGCLFVYSPNTPFPVTEPDRPNGVTRFTAYAVLEHKGDESAAARAVRAMMPAPDPADTPSRDSGVNVGAQPSGEREWPALIIDGKTWLTSGPDHPEPLWGTERTMLAAKGQPTTIAGPQGSGKSVFGQRLALGHIGLVDHVLGLPVAPGKRNVLYLACDRPEQARLSTRRMVSDDQLAVLEQRMRVWKGPPPEDVAKQPLMLLRMAEAADGDLLVIDSAKDVALKLSADEVGAAYNSALQHCIAAGVEVIVLHHPRKLGGEVRDNPVRALDDLYGAYWVTAGNGSVIYLQPGDFETFTLTQLKSPIGEKAEIPYEHVIAPGDVRAPTTPGLEQILAEAPDDGISGVHAARCLYKVDKPSDAQIKKVRRVLNEMVEDGTAETVGRTKAKRWKLAE